MKKLIFLFAAMVMLFTSCEGPAGRDGLDGLDGEGANWFVKDYTIRASDWKLIGGADNLNSYFMAEIKVNELSKFVYESGNVFCYMYQNVNGTEVQTLLPYTVPMGSDNGNGTESLWTETYACDFTEGSIAFYVNYSDFYTKDNAPGAATFRVVLNW